MNNSRNLNLERLRKQLNNSTNVNVLKKPNNSMKNVINNLNKKVKKSQVKTKIKPKIQRKIKPTIKDVSNNNKYNLLSIFLTLVILLLICFIFYNLYVYFKEKSLSQLSQSSQPQIRIQQKYKVENIQKPKGVILDKEGAPISVERGGDITENKYLSLYGGDDFMKRETNIVNNNCYKNNLNSSYASYPGYYSQADDGITKVYYQKIKNNSKINNYIRNQNRYIRKINKRVREINENRLNTPVYSRDKVMLQEVRNYERKLANKVHRETKNQPYLPDQNILM